MSSVGVSSEKVKELYEVALEYVTYCSYSTYVVLYYVSIQIYSTEGSTDNNNPGIACQQIRNTDSRIIARVFHVYIGTDQSCNLKGKTYPNMHDKISGNVVGAGRH